MKSQTNRIEILTRAVLDQKSISSSDTNSADIPQPPNEGTKLSHAAQRRPSSLSENSEEMQTAFRGEEDRSSKDQAQPLTASEWDQVPAKPSSSRPRARTNFANVSNKSGSSRTTSSFGSSSNRFRTGGGHHRQLPFSTSQTDDPDRGGGDESEQLVTYRICQLTAGSENVLLHHLSLDVGDGVYLW